MKQLLITIAALVLVGCGESQQPATAPEAKTAKPAAEATESFEFNMERTPCQLMTAP